MASAWLGILALAFPWLYLLSLGCLALALARRQFARFPWTWLPLLTGFPLWGGWLAWNTPASGSLRVLSLNTNYFQAVSDRRRVPENIQAVREFLAGMPLDIVCAQDYSTDSEANNEAMHSFFRDDLKLLYRIYRTSSMSSYSRDPIPRYQGQIFTDSQNSYLWIDTRLGGRPVRVYNLHLQSYQLGLKNRSLSKFRSDLGQRMSQADLVAQSIQDSPYPVIVCGDFNDVPTSYVYRRLARGLVDGFREAGRGVAITYRGPIPGLRIDYILCSPELRFTRYQHLRGPAFLDHDWVYAELDWRHPG